MKTESKSNCNYRKKWIQCLVAKCDDDLSYRGQVGVGIFLGKFKKKIELAANTLVPLFPSCTPFFAMASTSIHHTVQLIQVVARRVVHVPEVPSCPDHPQSQGSNYWSGWWWLDIISAIMGRSGDELKACRFTHGDVRSSIVSVVGVWLFKDCRCRLSEAMQT